MVKKIPVQYDEKKTDRQTNEEILPLINRWWNGDLSIIMLPSWVHVTLLDTETGEITKLDEMFREWNENEKTKNGKVE